MLGLFCALMSNLVEKQTMQVAFLRQMYSSAPFSSFRPDWRSSILFICPSVSRSRRFCPWTPAWAL